MAATKFKTVDEYIASFPLETQSILQQLRTAIHEAAPGVEEKISYQMPAFDLHGRVAYLSAWKNHIGMYGYTTEEMDVYKDELAPYMGEKGSLRFPLKEPMPLELITGLVKARAAANLAKAARR